MNRRRKSTRERRRSCMHHDPSTARSFVVERDAGTVACSECGQPWAVPANSFYEEDEPVEQLVGVYDVMASTGWWQGIRVSTSGITEIRMENQ